MYWRLIPLYCCIVFYYMNLHCFQFGLLWIKMLWTFAYGSLCGRTYVSFIVSEYLGVDFLDHMANVSLTLYNTARTFPKFPCHFTFLPAVCESSSCFRSLPALGVASLFKFSHRNECIMFLKCIFNFSYHIFYSKGLIHFLKKSALSFLECKPLDWKTY